MLKTWYVVEEDEESFKSEASGDNGQNQKAFKIGKSRNNYLILVWKTMELSKKIPQFI